MRKLAVIALGGNALLRGDQKGTIDEQEDNILRTCSHILKLIEKDYDIVITHGNGPQVGNVLLQHEAGNKLFDLPKMPLDICVAETQGAIGYMIEQQLRNVLEQNNIQRDILSIITQVLVDKSDPAFENPTKPVGPFYTEDEVEDLQQKHGWVMKEDAAGRGWRRVVASPRPYRIGNKKSIEKLARGRTIVVTVGGGGIPVFYVEPQKLQGIDAVIDKDLASSILASQINADEFIILTDIPKVCVNFNTPQQKEIDKLSIFEAKKLLAEGQFGEGSMAPKIRSAISFVESGGSRAIITEASNIDNPEKGTQIILFDSF